MTDRIVALPGADIACDAAPPGSQTVIVAHGLTASRAAEDDEGIFDWSATANEGRALIRYDARGHGKSGGYPVPTDFTWDHMAADLLAVIDEVSPDAPVDAIGSSMGTAAIIIAAIARPDRFRRLVLSIPPTAWESRAPQAERYLAGAEVVESAGVAGLMNALAAQPQPTVLTDGGWRAELPTPAVRRLLLPAVFRGAALSDLPKPATIAQIPHRTLILAWDTDPGHPVSTAEHLAEIIPDAILEIATTPDAIRGWGARAAQFLDA